MAEFTIPEALLHAARHHSAGRLPVAEAILKLILQRDPNCWGALHLLGIIALQTGRHAMAVEVLRPAARLAPEDPAIHSNLGEAYRLGGRLEEAVACYRQALAVRPDFHEALGNLGLTLSAQGRLDDAAQCLRQAIALKPDFAEAYNNLGNVAWDRKLLDEALTCYQRAVTLQPQLATAHSNLGLVLSDLGRIEEAVTCFRRALSLRPDAADFHSSLIQALNYLCGDDAETIAAELRQWNARHGHPAAQPFAPHSNDRSAERTLRIGYVSADFRDHVVGHNLLPLFTSHDRKRFEIHCYAHVAAPDAFTEKFRSLAHHWRDISSLDDTAVAGLARQDGIDILVDLALHTAKNRLRVFARKPAPVQVSFAGYPGGTGLQAIDYHLTDPYLEPPTPGDQSGPDAPFRLPHSFWCYTAPAEAPEVGPLPAQASGHVTFGCLNNVCKVTDSSLRLWARVLVATPGARLQLLVPNRFSTRRTCEILAAAGVKEDRVDFIERRPRQEYLRLYQSIDLGLDTIPYHGHTTSLDSYWMGVPVVTLVGRTSVARAGWSQLSNLGLTELAAREPDEFVALAAGLARDPGRLAALRAGLRERMRQSPLMDAAGFAHAIENAYRAMWQRWCERRTSEACAPTGT